VTHRSFIGVSRSGAQPPIARKWRRAPPSDAQTLAGCFSVGGR
jgi:hypothetical protein